MAEVERFSFSSIKNALGETALRPLVPLTLIYQETPVQASGLLDTGADVNVLPYNLGIVLGGVWDEARTGLRLSGNLANYEARGILMTCVVGQLAPVQLAFAWTRAENVPLILGQVNFFSEFDLCFFRARNSFEIRLKT